MNRCQADSYCKGFPNVCNEYCIGYIQMQNIYKLSNMPKKYQYGFDLTLKDEKDRPAYIKLKNWQDNVTQNVQTGKGLYIHSKTKGNGKTSWCCKIINQYFRIVALSNNLRCRGLYIHVPSFLQRLREMMDNPNDDTQELLDNVMTADIVLWDDIGAEKPTEWVRERLLTFINHREAEGLTQLYTSNKTLDELGHPAILDERIASRIKGQCDIVEFVGPDRRGDKDPW